MASVVAIIMHSLRLPYKDNWLNNLQFSSLLLIVMTFIAGINYQIVNCTHDVTLRVYLYFELNRKHIEVSR